MRHIRMKRAAELLKDNMRPIKAIAVDCGYDDVSNFYRDFRKVYGMTPKHARITAHPKGESVPVVVESVASTLPKGTSAPTSLAA